MSSTLGRSQQYEVIRVKKTKDKMKSKEDRMSKRQDESQVIRGRKTEYIYKHWRPPYVEVDSLDSW